MINTLLSSLNSDTPCYPHAPVAPTGKRIVKYGIVCGFSAFIHSHTEVDNEIVVNNDYTSPFLEPHCSVSYTAWEPEDKEECYVLLDMINFKKYFSNDFNNDDWSVNFDPSVWEIRQAYIVENGVRKNIENLEDFISLHVFPVPL